MFALVTVLMIVLMMSLFSTMIMLPLFLQNVLLLSALSAGLVLMPGGILNGLMAPVSGVLFDKFGPKVLVIPGLFLMTLSIYLFSRIESTWSAGYVILIARLENSSQIPRVDTLIKVAIALGMNINLNESDEQAFADNHLAHV